MEMSAITKPTTGLLTLLAVAADIGELRTAPHDTALPVRFVPGAEPCGGILTLCWTCFFSPMSWLFIILFYVSKHASQRPLICTQIQSRECSGGGVPDALIINWWDYVNARTKTHSN